jgi:hypothetical protein
MMGLPQQSTTIDGTEYTASKLKKLCGISKDGARFRIVRYNAGEITKAELLHKGKLPRRKICAVIDGKVYKAEDIAEITGLKLGSALNRLYQFCRGVITAEDLLHAGPSDRHRKESEPSAEWLAMTRRAGRFEFTPGTWESRNIQDRRQI